MEKHRGQEEAKWVKGGEGVAPQSRRDVEAQSAALASQCLTPSASVSPPITRHPQCAAVGAGASHTKSASRSSGAPGGRGMLLPVFSISPNPVFLYEDQRCLLLPWLL